MSGGEPTQRLERLLGYFQRDSQNVPLLLEIADLALRVGRGEEALAWLEQTLIQQPGESRLAAARGNLLLALARPGEAAEVFLGLIERHGPDPVLRFNLAQAWFFLGKYQESLDVMLSVPETARGNLPDFDLILARVAYYCRREEDALVAVDRFLASKPGHSDALGLKAMLLCDAGRETESVALAQALLRQDRGNWQAHLALGSAALTAQDAAASEAHFGEVVNKLPDAGRAWSGLGFAALMRRQLPMARERFEKAVQQMTEHPGTWQGLAWTNILLGDLKRAREAVDRSIEVDRNFADNHGTLAIIEFLQGKHTEAELSVRKALRLNPASPSALYARSLLQDAASQHDKASANIERILAAMEGPQGAALLKVYQESRRQGGPGVPRPPQPRKLH